MPFPKPEPPGSGPPPAPPPPADPAVAAAVERYAREHGPLLILHLDGDLRVTRLNATARRILGNPSLGRSLLSVLGAGASSPDPSAFLARPELPHRLTVTTPTGLPETYWFHFVPLPEGGALAIGSPDVAELHRLSQEALKLNRDVNDLARQLQQANAELRELNRLKTQFLGMAAHDLRRPVSVLLTYGGFILDEAGNRLGTEHRAFLETCLAAAGGMKRQIDDFLDVALIESGHWHVCPAPTRLPALLESVVSHVRLLASRKRVELRVVSPDSDPGSAQVDPGQVEQVLVNLLANAIEYSPEGATVTLAVCPREQAWIFSIADQGPGIAPEAQAKLFQPFSTAGTRKTANERSVGLGLAIARMVVLAHQGSIWVESVPGHGSTFFVSLPIDPTAAPPLPETPRPE